MSIVAGMFFGAAAGVVAGAATGAHGITIPIGLLSGWFIGVLFRSRGRRG